MSTDEALETKIARDVEVQLARLVIHSPKLAELPIAPLIEMGDLIRLELALGQFAQVHHSGHSRRLILAVRTILCVARTRLRVDGRRAVVAAETRSRS